MFLFRFEVREEQVDGSFCLMLWENDNDAIVSGRELLERHRALG